MGVYIATDTGFFIQASVCVCVCVCVCACMCLPVKEPLCAFFGI